MSEHKVAVLEPRATLGGYSVRAFCNTCGWTETSFGLSVVEAQDAAQRTADQHEGRPADLGDQPGPGPAQQPPRRRLTNTGAIALMWLVAGLVVVLLWSIKESNDSEEWCKDSAEFYRENPWDARHHPERYVEFENRCGEG